MRMRAAYWVAVLGFLSCSCLAAPKPADWVPARWPWADAKSLDLLAGGPVNCLLLKDYSAGFAAAAKARGLVTLALVTPGPDSAASADRALAAGLTGLALEGDFEPAALKAIRAKAGTAPIVEITSRRRLLDLGAQPVYATYQGVWPGVSEENGAKKAGPTGSVWIDTNTGFIRSFRAWNGGPLWIANEPPPNSVNPVTRYMQAISDAAMSGARWVLAFDADFASRLAGREPAAMAGWNRMMEVARFFEGHPEWRGMSEYGRLALVEDPARGGLISGGILDMIAVKHTPVRPIPPDRLSPEALKGASMAVNVDSQSLTQEQRDVLRAFARSGGTLLNGPPGWRDPEPAAGRITLESAELSRLNDIWRDVNSMVGRRNLGVRLFNVSSMLSNFLVSADGKSAVLHLVNYSDYPVENVTVHFLGDYKRATLLTPEGTEKPLEIYKTEEGWGADIDHVSACATLALE